MVNYQLGKIYKIECNVTGLIYIGSTCEPTLARRLAGHTGNYKRYLNDNKCNYVTSFKVLENSNYDIILIENYPCSSKDELHARERYYTNQIDCVNKVKNQGLLNKLGQHEYDKQQYQKNKDHIKQIKKQYRETNRDTIAQYRNIHKDYYNQYCKQYRETHKEEIKQRVSKKYTCECGGKYTHSNKSLHLKSNKHLEHLKNN